MNDKNDGKFYIPKIIVYNVWPKLKFLNLNTKLYFFPAWTNYSVKHTEILHESIALNTLLLTWWHKIQPQISCKYIFIVEYGQPNPQPLHSYLAHSLEKI